MINTDNLDGFQFKLRPYSKNSLDLIHKRYLANHNITIDEWFDRVIAHLISYYDNADHEIVKQYQILLKSRAFLPTSAALLNSLYKKGSLAGCIVIELTRDIERLFSEVLPKIVKMQITGTGVGLDLSILAPRLAYDSAKKITNPGPIELLVSIAQAVEGPMQYVGVKRAAFMATLFIRHPDIFEFITMKQKHRLAQVNISVTTDETFRQAVEQDGLLPLLWDDDKGRHLLTTDVLTEMKVRAEKRSVRGPDFDLAPHNQVFSKAANRLVGRVINGVVCLRAKTLLRFMAENAHECGDPGLINLHTINESNPTHTRHAPGSDSQIGVGIIKTTTPCGEQPLLPYEVCHLGSLNLSAFIDDLGFNFKAFASAIKVAVRFMDDLITVGDNELIEANLIAKANRKIGLGIMGLADALAELEIPYDSEDALAFAHRVGETLQATAEETSQTLAVERGVFKNWKYSKYHPKEKRRNATLTTIAPTGHIATIADCSTGIEPYYLLSYQRDAAGIKTETCSVIERKLKNIDFSLQEWIQKTNESSPYVFDGTLAGLCDNPLPDKKKNLYLKKLKMVFKTAHEIEPQAHLAMVKVLQKYIDNGISKTINLHNNSTIDLVEYLLFDALSSNLKGITVFRDGCLDKQALFTAPACAECEGV